MVLVTSAAEALARDAAAGTAGVPSRVLMQRAGAAAAAEISHHFASRTRRGVVVFAGPGNNGGDAWVVARALAAVGIEVRVVAIGSTKAGDSSDERALAQPLLTSGDPTGAERIVVDGLLGTGSKGDPQGEVANAIARIRELRSRGAVVVSLDVPSGVDATTGRAETAVVADLTITFGTMKRGLLAARGNCGRIVVVDIGLVPHAESDSEPALVSAAWVAPRIPPIRANAHKGERKRLAIIGGGIGMAGAAILAARAAMRSGIGIVRLFLAKDNIAIAQTAAPEALARAWPESDDEAGASINEWAHGVVLGPGLGNSDLTRELAERVLRVWRGPVVVDADALNVFEGDAPALGKLLRGREALITPHAAECARLVGMSTEEVLASRFEVGVKLARKVGGTVLLKGVPTIVTNMEGKRLVSAAGSPVLGVAGSGDVLAGIAGTLVTQRGEAFESAAAAAWIHGRAGEIASRNNGVRGGALDDVLDALAEAWQLKTRPPRYPVIAQLPRIPTADPR